jgi:hypothetical protein
MSMPAREQKPLSVDDLILLKGKRTGAYFTLLKFYGTLFVGLIWVYFELIPGNTYHGETLSYGKLTPSDYRHVYYFVALFFGTIFLYFLVRDYRKMVIPLQKELRGNSKNCIWFPARKYKDPIYNNCLLFYPQVEDIYIKVSANDFDSIINGSDMYMETGCLTGEVLLLKSGDKIFCDATEFSFSELAVRPELDDMLDEM